MFNGLLVTTENLGRVSGAGSVVNHALKALLTLTDECASLDMPSLMKELEGVPYDPFLVDYVASEYFEDLGVTSKFVHFNGAPFVKSLKALHMNNYDLKCISDCAPHNLDISVEEHKKVAGFYPNPHMENARTLNLFMKHIRMSDLVIVPSNVGIEYLKETFEMENEMIAIPHGTDIPEYKEPTHDTFRVGYLGRSGPDKGLRYLFGAWSGLAINGELCLTGSDLVEATKIYVDKLREIGTSKITVTDFQEDKWAYLQSLSVYVQPSVTEGFGIPCLEAMAAGRQVIVTEGAGVAEYVRDGVDGYVVPIRDAKAIHSCLLELYLSPEKVKKMGENARETAKKYSWDNIEKMYVEVYKDFVE